MKKHFLFGAMAALMLSFSACDTNEIIEEVIDEGIFGSATVYLTSSTGNDTLEFSSAITDKYTVDDTIADPLHATLALCSTVDLRQGELAFPYLAFQFGDTVAGNYQFQNIITGNILKNFCYDTISALLHQPCGTNLLLIGQVQGTDTIWYVSESGQLNISSYPGMGHNLEGTVTNMQVLRFTTADIENNKDAIEAAIEANPNMHISDLPFVQTCTLNAVFHCRRAAIIQDIIAAFGDEDVPVTTK